MSHSEMHRSHRVGWLRAAVLGANDGIVSTASLIIGVAAASSAHDALGAHAKDEIGISESTRAQPIQAAFSSAITFTVGATLPLAAAWVVPGNHLIFVVAVSSLVFLALLGAIAASAGGASMAIGAMRVTFWGALAMALTAGVGRMFGVVA